MNFSFHYLSTFLLFKYKYFPYLKLMIAIGCFNSPITIKVCKFFLLQTAIGNISY